MSVTAFRSQAICLRCQPPWRRWMRQRSYDLGVNESGLIEMACSWFASQCGFPEDSPPLWIPETNLRFVDPWVDSYKDTALYVPVTPDWKNWATRFATSQQMSLAWMVEQAIFEHSCASGVNPPPPRTRYFTHVLR